MTKDVLASIGSGILAIVVFGLVVTISNEVKVIIASIAATIAFAYLRYGIKP